MNLSVWTLESDYRARWLGQVPTLPIYTTFDDIDWTADGAPRVGAQVVFDGIDQGSDVANAAIVPLRYSAHVFIDVKRATSEDKTLAASAVAAAMSAAVGWNFTPSRLARLAGGQRTGFDGRILRVSVSFLLPAVATSLA